MRKMLLCLAAVRSRAWHGRVAVAGLLPLRGHLRPAPFADHHAQARSPIQGLRLVS
jgi:hypothetical protein